jgi:adenosine deaminase
VQTGAVASIAEHPFDLLARLRFRVTVNTDNRLMSDTTLTDEYALAAERLRFTADELSAIALNGFQSAFLPLDERHGLIESARGEIAAWREGTSL